MSYNKYLNLIPWHILEEYLKSEKERWTVVAIMGSTNDERETARGRVAELMELLNLPNTLDMLYKEEEKENKDNG